MRYERRVTIQSLYRRPLPDDLVPFASDEGRRVFREALATGHMEGFFALSEQFHTQADPAFCGLGSLVVALNALAIDPGRLWKGPWRWFSEELLDCCAPLERVREKGISLDELGCLAQCNGAEARVKRGSIDELRADVALAARSAREPVVIASYTRKALGQTGDGHFSPIGGYLPARDLVLLLDVARFKYPPHWVPLAKLHEAMQAADSESGRPRGWVVLERRTKASALVFSISTKRGVDDLLRTWTTDLPNALVDAADARTALTAFAAALERSGAALEIREAATEEHQDAVRAVHEALRTTKTFELAQSEPAAALALAAPPETWSKLRSDVLGDLVSILESDRSNEILAPEIARMKDQLQAIERFASRRC
jgi:glutathione gamma-glutamylcysteinyltransferase